MITASRANIARSNRAAWFFKYGWIVLLPLALYVGVTLYWLAREFNPIIGDEPHYLLTADSIARDGDLFVTNNYLADTPVSAAIGAHLNANDADHVVNHLSVHGIGIPLLIAPAYALGGIAGAKIFLASLIGIVLPLVVFGILQKIVSSRKWSAFLTVAFVCVVPFLAGSNQIYTDLIAGILVLHATHILVHTAKQNSFAPHALLILGMEIAFLPWLYKRYIPITLVLLAITVWLTWRAQPKLLSRAVLFGYGVIVCSFLALGAYQYFAFQNPFGFFAQGQIQFEPRKVLMILLGLHWDSFQGIFIQDPLLWLALLGIIPFVRNDGRGALIVAAVYLTVILPGAMNFTWYGGASFAGRYAWAALGLWAFPFGYAVKAILNHRGGSYIAVLFGVASFVFQAALAREWLTRNRFLYNDGLSLPIWASRDFYTMLFGLDVHAQSLLPWFRSFGAYTMHLPNYLIIGFTLLLIATGVWFYATRMTKNFLVGVWIVFGIGAFWMQWHFEPRLQPIIFNGAAMYSRTGQVQGTSRVAEAGKRGYLVFGPYIQTFPNRTYALTLDYQTSDDVAARIDFALDYGKFIFLKQDLPPSSSNNGKLRQTFTIPDPQVENPPLGIFEFDLNYRGRGKLIVERFEIRPLEKMPPLK